MIVESYSKCKKIQSYLGQTWDIQASSGHISELPKQKLAIDLQNYEPEFVVMNEKKSLIKLEAYLDVLFPTLANM